MLCTEIVSDIQDNFCTQHVVSVFYVKKSFWKRFTCTFGAFAFQRKWWLILGLRRTLKDRRSESRGRCPSCRKALIFFLSLTRIAADMPLGGRNSLSVLISYLDHMTCHNLLLPSIRSAGRWHNIYIRTVSSYALTKLIWTWPQWFGHGQNELVRSKL